MKKLLLTFLLVLSLVSFISATTVRIPEWEPNVYYDVGAQVMYNNSAWQCQTAHTSNSAWYPGAPGVYLWKQINNPTTPTPTTMPTATLTPTPTETPTPPPFYQNIAIGKKAVASSIFSSDFPADVVVDGDRKSPWGSQVVSPNKAEWIYVDLGSVRQIDGVGFYWFDQYYAKKYSIYVSNNGNNWTHVVNITKTNGEPDVLYGTANVRYVAILCTIPNKTAFALGEFEIYQLVPITPTPTATPTATPTSTAVPTSTYPPIIENHRKAGEITGLAQKEVLRSIQPGMIEGDFQVIIDRIFNENGSSGLAFNHITASGPNSLILHYEGTTRTLNAGEVFLVDIGAKYNGYCGDITRTYPVGGKFTPRQREIYQLVLDCHKAAAAAMEPNNQSLSQMTTFAKNFFRNSPLRAKDKYGVERTMDYFFIHSLSHYIGKDVHGSDLPYSNSEPVKPGRVFSIEPGIYIDSENFGVRLEDDFLMTETGAVNLNPDIPIEIADIEAMMQNPIQQVISAEERAKISERQPAERNHMDF